MAFSRDTTRMPRISRTTDVFGSDAARKYSMRLAVFWSCIACLPTYCLQLRDFEYLGRALLEICAEILENVKSAESEAALTDVQEALHNLSV